MDKHAAYKHAEIHVEQTNKFGLRFPSFSVLYYRYDILNEQRNINS